MDKRDAPLYLILHLRILEIAIYLFRKHEAASDTRRTHKQYFWFCFALKQKCGVKCLMFMFMLKHLLLLSVWLPPILLLDIMLEYFSNMRNRRRGSQCQQKQKSSDTI